ncbi:guanine deaminase [Cyphellophora europaea CBS 101466]|uniref:Probable guanine deaminase n=1 Tax=Cyphellophora europaea (strain CBS 101466) TaxID=1220924 RepID=W2RTI9_CYPE1|nr:guanine deaminase [Cyphellophora europaea CBS 101466]ETN39767.1 guanine deaminase [Cyphellophora europaea CBS 101466]
MSGDQGFHGTLIHSPSPEAITILEDTLIIVSDRGVITRCDANISRDTLDRHLAQYAPHIQSTAVKRLPTYSFLTPGFVDTHNHAPQYPQRGLGQGLHILDWLSQLTFPNEAKFASPTYAHRMYSRAIDTFLQQGTTTASYYGSLHGEATKILATLCHAKGQRALVGKCNMNRNSPAYYSDASATESLTVTEDFLSHVHALDPGGDLVRPILTPRFAISCTDDLLTGLGHLAEANPDLPIQTHFNEAQQEIDATLSLFPASNEADLYDHFRLLTPRTILAHCTIMDTEHEYDVLKGRGCGVAHCPIANTTIGGGFMAAPIRRFLDRGINVGLGTDSGGGFSSSILDAIRQAIVVSNAREAQSDGNEKSLSLDEVFYLATLGGAKVCGLGEKIGSFEVGKELDAMIVRPNLVLGEDSEGKEQVLRDDDGVMTPVEVGDDIRTVWEKWLVSGNDKNIAEVYVKGRRVKG